MDKVIVILHLHPPSQLSVHLLAVSKREKKITWLSVKKKKRVRKGKYTSECGENNLKKN